MPGSPPQHGKLRRRLARSRFARIREPVGERHGTAAVRHAAGIFLQATAVDRSGNRTGQGCGYYGKFLASLQDSFPLQSQPHDGAAPVQTAAVVHDTEVLPAHSIPGEPFNRKVSAVLTPAGVHGLATSRSRDDRISTQALRLLRDGTCR